jgi:hypothetical protein
MIHVHIVALMVLSLTYTISELKEYRTKNKYGLPVKKFIVYKFVD